MCCVVAVFTLYRILNRTSRSAALPYPEHGCRRMPATMRIPCVYKKTGMPTLPSCTSTVLFSFMFFFRHLFYLSSSGEAVVTGLVPSPRGNLPSLLSLRGFIRHFRCWSICIDFRVNTWVSKSVQLFDSQTSTPHTFALSPFWSAPPSLI